MSYPTDLDNLGVSNPSSSDNLGTGPHHTLHSNERDAIDALEAKLGINSSAVNTSIDYFLKHASGAYRTHTHDASSDDGANIPEANVVFGPTGHDHSGTTNGNLIPTAGIEDSAVTTAKIADANVITAKIADANVTTAKIADANVTSAKLDSVTAPLTLKTGYQETGSWGFYNACTSGSVLSTYICFKTIMTNIPSSITINVTASNVGTNVVAVDITKYGFCVVLNPTGTGTANAYGTWTTVGN